MKYLRAVVCVGCLAVMSAAPAGCGGMAQMRGKCSAGAVCCRWPEGATVLFDGKDFSQWIGEDGNEVKWRISGGVMEIVPGTGSIVTRENYRDFRLHVEFNIPVSQDAATGQARGNSGVYIQKRYEIQILDSFGLKAGDGDCGAIYRTKAPDRNMSRKAGEWQSFDIIFRSPRFEGDKKMQNARATVVHNGYVIHNNAEVPNKTGAGEAEGPQPGPIKLQDHGAAVRFRNIWICPL